MDLQHVGVTQHQQEVLDAFIAERCAERQHVVVHLSGAHAYGFPSPDSDLDLKAIHVAPTASLLGLRPADGSFDRLVTVEGVELDYTSNELGPVLGGILRGNGNYLERVLGATEVVGSPWLDELRPVAARALSRRVAHHYRGFAEQQRRSLIDKPTVKRLLYVLRTASTGIHALRTGQIVPDLRVLAAEYAIEGVAELIERKQQGEKTALDASDADRWKARVDALMARIDDERRTSSLPESPANEPEVEAWLLDVRRRLF